MVLLFSALGLLAIVVVYDLLQRQHAILRNFPIIGHVRYWLEAVGPELRQYIVTNNNEERPFSRDQRRWVYASSKQADTSFGFGSDQDMERQSNYLVIKHQTFPLQTPVPGDPAYDPQCTIACAKVLGAARGRAKAFRPASVVNVSGTELRIPERPGGRSAQPRGADRRLPAQHRRRGRLAISPQRRGPGLADRHRLLRLP